MDYPFQKKYPLAIDILGPPWTGVVTPERPPSMDQMVFFKGILSLPVMQ